MLQWLNHAPFWMKCSIALATQQSQGPIRQFVYFISFPSIRLLHVYLAGHEVLGTTPFQWQSSLSSCQVVWNKHNTCAGLHACESVCAPPSHPKSSQLLAFPGSYLTQHLETVTSQGSSIQALSLLVYVPDCPPPPACFNWGHTNVWVAWGSNYLIYIVGSEDYPEKNIFRDFHVMKCYCSANKKNH